MRKNTEDDYAEEVMGFTHSKTNVNNTQSGRKEKVYIFLSAEYFDGRTCDYLTREVTMKLIQLSIVASESYT